MPNAQAPPPLVLLVEDEAMLALELQDVFEEAGYRTACAAAAAEVAAFLESERPFAAVVDMRLRDGLTGPEIAERLFALQIPVILHTGERSDAIAAVPAHAVVHKPSDPEKLVAIVRSLAA